MRTVRLLAGVCVLAATAMSPALHARKKKSDEITQTLQLPKDPPGAVIADATRLVFHISPLSAKGLLSQQVRDGLKALARTNGSSTMVKLRAFVAGSGDMRRVQAIVSEVFTDRRQPLPAVSVVQVGALPLEAAQVVLESISVSKKEVNPHGLAFISGQGATSSNPLDPIGTLADKSFAGLRTAVRAAGSQPDDVLRVTCYSSSLQQIDALRARLAAEYHGAALNFVQVQRAPVRAVVECEAVARLLRAPEQPVQLLNPPGLSSSPNYSQIALIGAARIALTGTQVAFGFGDADARLAFERLRKALEQVGASFHDVVVASYYPLSESIAEQVRRMRFEFLDKGRPPASTMLPFEGLPSIDASFAMDVVAVTHK